MAPMMAVGIATARESVWYLAIGCDFLCGVRFGIAEESGTEDSQPTWADACRQLQHRHFLPVSDLKVVF